MGLEAFLAIIFSQVFELKVAVQKVVSSYTHASGRIDFVFQM